MSKSLFSADFSSLIAFHGGVIHIRTENGISLIGTAEVVNKDINPLTQKQFTAQEKEFISERCKTHAFCMNGVDIPGSIEWYNEYKKELVPEQIRDPYNKRKFETARYFMFPHDLYGHFKNYERDTSLIKEFIRYERADAEKALKESKTRGIWLLRHSSYNRDDKGTHKLKVEQYGVRYFALSFVDKLNGSIKHTLFKYTPGIGWSAKFAGKKFYHVHFVDMLNALLKNYGLEYANIKSDYVEAHF